MFFFTIFTCRALGVEYVCVHMIVHMMCTIIYISINVSKDDGTRVEGFNPAQASGVVSARAPIDTVLFGHFCFVLRDACGVECF